MGERWKKEIRRYMIIVF